MKKTAAFLLIVMLMTQLMPMLSGFAETGEAETSSQVVESVQTPAPTDEAEETAAPEAPTESAPPTETAAPTKPTEAENAAFDAFLNTIPKDIFERDTLTLRDLIPDDDFLWKYFNLGEEKYHPLTESGRDNRNGGYYNAKYPREERPSSENENSKIRYSTVDKEYFWRFMQNVNRFELKKSNKKIDNPMSKSPLELFVRFCTNPDEITKGGFMYLSLDYHDGLLYIHYAVQNSRGEALLGASGVVYAVNNTEAFNAALLKEYIDRYTESRKKYSTKTVVYDNYNPTEGTIQHYPSGKGGRLSPRQNKATLIDRISFTVTLDDTYADTLLRELAGDGDTLRISVDNIFVGNYLLLLTISGNGGTKQLYKVIREFNYSMVFADHQIFFLSEWYENGEFFFQDRPYHSRVDQIFINCRLKSCKVGYKRVGAHLENALPTTLNGTDIQYELINDRGKDSSLLALDKDKADYATTATPQPTQDPKRDKTELRAEYDTHTADFFIDLAGHCKANTAAVRAPEWLKEIGGEESATVDFINICHTENGVYDPDSVDSPMFHITGEKGDKWFFITSSQIGQFPEGVPLDNKTIYIKFMSCLSFNGTTIVRNMLEYDVLNTYFVFTNDDKTELDYILLEFGAGSRVKIPQKEISYLGDCNKTYEKWKKGV